MQGVLQGRARTPGVTEGAPPASVAPYTLCVPAAGGDSAAVVEGVPPGIAAGVASLRPCMY